MTEITWSDKFACNVRPIDDDHKNLFEVVDRLARQLQADPKSHNITATIDSLILYAGEHFEREERFMRSAHFPDYHPHKSEHEEFKQVILALRALFVEDPGQVDPARVLSYLVDWLQQHIMQRDMAYIPYVNGTVEVADDEAIEVLEPIEITIRCTPDKVHSIELFAELISGDHKEARLLEEAAHKFSRSHRSKSLLKAKKLFCLTLEERTAHLLD